ncbi:L,D-transpeptidase [Actinomadura xylanilytica]|uniref:L,D-transpeptidase n=1 Tax=Actinomadura xylanilytica TaxID=887459 RepID=UPI00255ADA07|nr:Ig-like domain-containing protein [Actinomadura xylanilytica]MDL4774969.1 Ig-like domain-containing protein [Actinomadura xylanilytica]
MQRRVSRHGSGRGTPLIPAGTALVLLAAATAACGGADRHRPPPARAASEAAAPGREPAVRTVPDDGARDVRPDRRVVVTAVRGTLRGVTVTARGGTGPVAGGLSADRRTWRSRWALQPGTTYRVAATGTDGDGPTRAESRFTTLTPAATFTVGDVTPRSGEVVGVGMPLVVTFSRPITDRAAVERALELRTSRPVTGAWHWTGAGQVAFRPRRYWPAGLRVTLLAHTAGVRAAPGVYGAAGHSTAFSVGASRISTVDTRRHRMTVRVDGRVVRREPISAGKGGRRAYTTASGVHLVMGKGDPVVMTSGWMGVTDRGDPRFYRLTVRHAVQISSSGEYVHSAPWSVGSQGRENVSHGCVNAAPGFARWFYGQSQRGDVVSVIGTTRSLEWNNGWGYWQLPWSAWVAGGALGRPVTTGPVTTGPVATGPVATGPVGTGAVGSGPVSRSRTRPPSTR